MLRVRLELTTSALPYTDYKYGALTDCATGATGADENTYNRYFLYYRIPIGPPHVTKCLFQFDIDLIEIKVKFFARPPPPLYLLQKRYAYRPNSVMYLTISMQKAKMAPATKSEGTDLSTYSLLHSMERQGDNDKV